MRLGILVFDAGESVTPAEESVEALTTVLRARDIDVVINSPEPDALPPSSPVIVPPSAEPDASAPPVPLSTDTQAQEAGARLGRADCDGVVFWMGAGANPVLVATTALFLACPILLCGTTETAALYEAAGVLADRGVAFDRLTVTNGSDQANAIEIWLTRNNRKERQKGTDAAQKLWGKRLVIPAESRSACLGVDAAQWFHQFGVVVVSASDDTGGAANDLFAANGDACGALTRFVLRGVSDDEAEARFLPAPAVQSEPADPISTLAQIYRRKGRFVCLLALSTDAQNAGFRNALYGSGLSLAPGDLRSRVKAACAALDIDVVEWTNGKTA